MKSSLGEKHRWNLTRKLLIRGNFAVKYYAPVFLLYAELLECKQIYDLRYQSNHFEVKTEVRVKSIHGVELAFFL